MKKIKIIYIAFISVCAVGFIVINMFSFIPYKKLPNDSYSFDELFEDCGDIFIDGNLNDEFNEELKNSRFSSVDSKVFKEVTDGFDADGIRMQIQCINKEFQYVSGHMVRYSGNYYLLFTARTAFRAVRCMLLIEPSGDIFDNYGAAFDKAGSVYGMYPTVSVFVGIKDFAERAVKDNPIINLSILIVAVFGTVLYKTAARKNTKTQE